VRGRVKDSKRKRERVTDKGRVRKGERKGEREKREGENVCYGK
jgi:hypothetical protein